MADRFSRMAAVLSGVTEFEYGAKGWWTAEFYLDGQTTANQSTISLDIAGRIVFRLLMLSTYQSVLYVEFGTLTGDKSLLKSSASTVV